MVLILLVLTNKGNLPMNQVFYGGKNKMEVKIVKTLISNDNKEFKVGNDIHFFLNRNNKIYDCFGIITVIKEDVFEINNVQIDKMNISDELTIKYLEVKDGIIHHTDNNWY